MKILNFGSLNIDKVYQVDKIVNKSETKTADRFTENIGGKGLNQSIAMRRAGLELYHAGAIGNDGEYLEGVLHSEGIDTQHIKRVDDVSGHAIIQVDSNGDNSIIVYGGSNKKITVEIIDEILSDFTENDVIILQNEISNVDYIIKEAYKKNMTIFVNPSPIDDQINKFLLEYVDYIILNEIEGKKLSGETEPEKILDFFEVEYPNAKIVLTLGEKGSIYSHKKNRIKQNAHVVITKDSSGAGDTFTGYFIASVLKGRTIVESLNTASIAGAISASRFGTSTSIPYINEITEFNRVK